MSDTWLRTIAGLVVLYAWLLSLTAGFFTHEWLPLQLVTPATLIVVGFLFGDRVVLRRRGDTDGP